MEMTKKLGSLNNRKLVILTMLVSTAIAAYLVLNVDMRFFDYAMSIRIPKLAVMLLTGFCIGTSSLVFQTLIQNTIVTPCLLGMNGLYILIHTTVVFLLGSTSIFVTNRLLSFSFDISVMTIASLIIYGVLFKKAKGNVLYILLAGSVMATFFSSITSTMQRIMDPNEYSALQSSLIASFNKVNSQILLLAVIGIVSVIIYLRKDIKLLDVITLGKDQAINLGVDYDRVVARMLIGVTIFIGIATAMVGPISFLGLILANLSRRLFPTYRHSYLIAGSALLGMVILPLGQILVEHVFAFSTNISVFINIGGGVYFLYLLLKNRRS